MTNMIEEISEKRTRREQPTTSKTTLAAQGKPAFTPSRFSVRRLRKHIGIQTGRTPSVIG